MSDTFLKDLGLPEPDFHLSVGSGSHAEQTGRVMVAYEQLCEEHRPRWTVVVGDVNSTVACALTAAKLLIPVAHLEAGLRSFDRTMPEEINRLVTDTLASLLWTPSSDGDANLRNEGIAAERIDRVGNIMIDSYELLRDRIEREQTRRKFGLEANTYGAVTLHRPSNVDQKATLAALVETLREVASIIPLVFPLHPRTRGRLDAFGLTGRLEACAGIHLTSPMSYIPFMGLVREARLVITDSGGLQEETTYLDIPCLTRRDTTERPITVDQGTNRLVETDQLLETVNEIVGGHWQSGRCPELWDGRTAGRVVESLRKRLNDET
jgi:UDP-N-acetylglucosamine 2-epimerase (non-hydrolysing)